MTTTSYAVNGLTCGYCIAEVMQRVRELVGVTGVAVDLVKNGSSPVVVTSGPELEIDEDGKVGPCLGEVRAYFPSDPGLRPFMTCQHEGCTHDERIWPAETWARLGARILERKGSVVTWDRVAMQRMAEAM